MELFWGIVIGIGLTLLGCAAAFMVWANSIMKRW